MNLGFSNDYKLILENSRKEAIILIADFLVTTLKKAEQIYEEEFGNV